MSKGAIVLVPFPFTDLSGNKVRPCVVLHDQKNGEDSILAFISSVKPDRSGPYNLPIKATAKNGLKKDSVIKIDKIATLQRRIVLGELGTAEPAVMKAMDSKIKHLFDLD